MYTRFALHLLLSTAAATACGSSASAPRPSDTPGAAGASAPHPSDTPGAAGAPPVSTSEPPVQPPARPPAAVSYQSSSEMLVSNGSTRSYLLAVPAPAAAAPLPLVIVLHWDGGNPTSARSSGPYLEEQAQGAAVFAYLEAADGNTFPYYTLAGRGIESVFVSDVIASLSAKGLVRADRVFLTGHSGGATMANAIACVLGSKIIRGSVVMSGSLYPIEGDDFWAVLPDGTEVRSCADDPATQIQWGEDDVGDTSFAGAGKGTRDRHLQLQGCASTTQPFNPAPCVSYDACSRGVGFCAIAGMGHAVWPSGAEAAWKFMASRL